MIDNTDYDNAFPFGLTDEEKSALIWKIEKDYRTSNLGAASFKEEYISFAINFYTRSIYSLEDVTVQYRAHKNAEHRKNRALAFLADMKGQIRDLEVAN